MSPSASLSRDRSHERRTRSFVHLLADICRRFPDLEEWLLEDFSRNGKTRTNFRELVDKGELPGEEAADGLAAIAGEVRGWSEERQRQRAKYPPETSRFFGGLTRDEMESLIARYEARTISLDVFLLARDWRKAGEVAEASPKMLRRGARFLTAVSCSADKKLLHQYGCALDVLTGLEAGKLRTSFGYADWWKLHALVYMMKHPRKAYRTREVRAHLAKRGLEISSLDFRRFCKRHGLARDERAGRPRARSAHAAN